MIRPGMVDAYVGVLQVPIHPLLRLWEEMTKKVYQRCTNFALRSSAPF